MLLDDLHFQAYRAFEDVRFEGMGRFSLFVGGNNAGKSSVLEGAGLIVRSLDPGQWIQAATNRDLTAPLVPSLWSMFPRASVLRLEDGPQASRTMEIDGLIAERRCRMKAVAAAVEGWDEKGEVEPVLRVDVERGLGKDDVVAQRMEFRRDPKIPRSKTLIALPHRVVTVTTATHRSTKHLVRQLSTVIRDGRKDLAIELLRLFDPGVSDIESYSLYRRVGICVTHSARGVVDLSSFGDGMRRALAFALALTVGREGLVLMDEVESGIHPRALSPLVSKLLEAARGVNAQILATTHSLEALDAIVESLKPSGLDEITGYHLSREEKGHRVRRYPGTRLASLRDGGLDLR